MTEQATAQTESNEPPASPSESSGQRRLLIFHPLFFAAFPVLQLLQANTTDVAWHDVWVPLGLSIAGALALLGIGRVVFRTFARAGLFASAMVFLFFSYGPISDELGKHRLFGVLLGRDIVLLPVWGVLALVVMIISWRARVSRNATKILNAVGVVLVLTTLVPIAAHGFDLNRSSVRRASASIPPPKAGATLQKRDIFYIVVEDYGSNETLKHLWNYDNTAFTDRLRKLGLYVADDSLSNYPNTSMSLASSFNMDYLDNLLEDPPGGSTKPSNDLLQEPEAARYLKARGYKYVHIGTWWSGSRKDSYADVNFAFGSVSEFSQTLLEQTLAWPIASKLGVGKTIVSRADAVNAGLPYQIEKTLESRSQFKEPTFTFVHLPVPHPPYVFDKNGRYVSPEQARAKGQVKAFLDQLTYTNKVVIRLIKSLMSGREGSQPVIILQTEEGPTRHLLGLVHSGLDEDSWSKLRWKFPILNAYYMPGITDKGLYSMISPVNTFRLIFNKYLGGDFPLLPDRAYIFREWTHNYDFVDVTKRLRR